MKRQAGAFKPNVTLIALNLVSIVNGHRTKVQMAIWYYFVLVVVNNDRAEQSGGWSYLNIIFDIL